MVNHNMALRPEIGSAATSALICACGRPHGDGGRLAKIGWRQVGAGVFALRAKCKCGAILTLARIDDASQCKGCRRLVTGTAADPKVCVETDGRNLVHCSACERRRRVRATSGLPRFAPLFAAHRRA